MDYVRLCLMWQVDAWMTTVQTFKAVSARAFDEPMRHPVAMVSHEPLYISQRFQDIPSQPTAPLAL
jgi:hypothetical protein